MGGQYHILTFIVLRVQCSAHFKFAGYVCKYQTPNIDGRINVFKARVFFLNWSTLSAIRLVVNVVEHSELHKVISSLILAQCIASTRAYDEITNVNPQFGRNNIGHENCHLLFQDFLFTVAAWNIEQFDGALHLGKYLS